MERTAARDWTSIAKDFAQIVALIIGGIWVLSTFRKKEAPTLMLRPLLEVTHSWQEYNGRTCTAQTLVSLRNDGITPFSVDSVRVRAWAKEYAYPEEFGPISLNDWLTESARDSQWLRVKGDHPMLNEYASGSSAYGTFNWHMKDMPGGRFLFDIKYFGSNGLTGTASWDDWICGSRE